MSDSVYYRSEARRMLEWAQTSSQPEMARRWSKLAEEYATLAEELEASNTGRPPILRGPMRQQLQQQQSKARDDKKRH